MDPVLVEVTRGARVESFHIGAAVAIDASGAVAFQAGDIDRPIYPRSAVKALQQLPLVETGRSVVRIPYPPYRPHQREARVLAGARAFNAAARALSGSSGRAGLFGPIEIDGPGP